MQAERLEEWAHGYKAEGVQMGMQQGMQKGEALALQKLLTKRFGAIPPVVLERIAAATTVQIDTWLDRVIDAQSLADLFGPNPQ